MQVYRELSELDINGPTAVTEGTFDGVHFGHRKILQRVINGAASAGLPSVVITYWPHPRFLLDPTAATRLKLLTTLDEKIQLFRELRLDHLLILPFNKHLSELTREAYVQQVLVDALNTQKMIIGYDHHFGRNREGNFAWLQQNAHHYNFSVEEIPAQEIDEVAVSSTKIRAALSEGDISTANRYLSYPYRISGRVVKGDQLGRTIGFPTANVEVSEPYKLIPAEGVYAVQVNRGGQWYGGMLNVGRRPTINNSNELRLEVHLFDFDDNLYGERIEVRFVKFLRPVQKFDGQQALALQLQKDAQSARQLLKQ